MPFKDLDYADLSESDIDELVSDGDGDDTKLNVAGDSNRLLRGSLQRPRHSTLNSKQLHATPLELSDMIHTGGIDLDAAYQRDVVWSESKMVGLIQSLFLNYYIPPIIFAVQVSRENPEADEIRVCIDGKQRCTSILNFMDGKIPFVSHHTKERFWYNKYGNQRHGSQLPDHLKRRFEQISIQVVEYDNLKDAQQRDIFQRVQMGVALSAPEKLQAIPGPWTEWIIELQKKYIIETHTLGDKLDWDTKRGKPFQALTAFIMLAYEANQTTAPTSSLMAKFLNREDPPDPHFKRKIEMALSLWVNIATNYYAEAFQTRPERVAPVETWFIGFLIFSSMGYLSLENLANKIGNMRKGIRRGHLDVRANSRVMKDLHTWIIDNAPAKRQAGGQVAAEEYAGVDVDEREVRALKRSRQAEEEDPSYLGDALPRGAAVPAPVTRAKVQKPHPARTEPAKSIRLAVPTVPTARPPPISMDAGPAPSPLPAAFGQPSPSNNPYTVSYPAAGAPYQKMNGSQPKQSNRSPVYPQAYPQPGYPQQRRNYPQDPAAQYAAMRRAEQKPQINQWGGVQNKGR